MSMSKKKRVSVYNKFAGRCAYCGNRIAYKEMEVDHFISQRLSHVYKQTTDKEIDDISNLMPACRTCNHYKRANGIQTFRKWIEEIPAKLEKEYIYKVGKRYGVVLSSPKPIEFFYEKVKDLKFLNEDDFVALKRGDRVYTEDKQMVIVNDVYCDGTFGMTVQDAEGKTYGVGELFDLI